MKSMWFPTDHTTFYKGVVGNLGKLYVHRKFRFPLVLFSSILVMVTLVLINNGSLQSQAGVEPVVLTVNGEPITQEEFFAQLEEDYGATVLEYLILERLIMQAGKEAGYVPSDAKIDAELAVIKSSYPSEEVFLQTLAQYNISVERIRRDIAVDLTLQYLATKDIELPAGAVEEYYEAHKYELGTPEMVEVHHIVVDDKQEAEQILQELKAGADFAEMARKKSIDFASVQQGGALGWVVRGQLPPALEDAVFALEINELSPVVETYFGYHIVKITDRKEATPAELDETLTQLIELQLKLERADIQAVFWELQQKAEIRVNWSRYSYLEKAGITE